MTELQRYAYNFGRLSGAAKMVIENQGYAQERAIKAMKNTLEEIESELAAPPVGEIQSCEHGSSPDHKYLGQGIMLCGICGEKFSLV